MRCAILLRHAGAQRIRYDIPSVRIRSIPRRQSPRPLGVLKNNNSLAWRGLVRLALRCRQLDQFISACVVYHRPALAATVFLNDSAGPEKRVHQLWRNLRPPRPAQLSKVERVSINDKGIDLVSIRGKHRSCKWILPGFNIPCGIDGQQNGLHGKITAPWNCYALHRGSPVWLLVRLFRLPLGLISQQLLNVRARHQDGTVRAQLVNHAHVRELSRLSARWVRPVISTISSWVRNVLVTHHRPCDREVYSQTLRSSARYAI